MFRPIIVGLVVALTGVVSETAQAADLGAFYGQPEEPDAMPPTDYTFGTGWYLRGDLTATDDAKPAVIGPIDTNTNTRRDWNYGLGGGAGYKFNNYFRADITGDYLGTQKTVIENSYSFGTLSTKANLRRFDGLVNAYIDFGTWAGITPYIGAGVGFAGVRLDGSFAANAPGIGFQAYRKFPGKTRYDLAWAAMAGVSFNVSPNLLIDIGYRYLDLGTYEVPRFVSGPFNQGLETDLTSHEIRAGLRYMIY